MKKNLILGGLIFIITSVFLPISIVKAFGVSPLVIDEITLDPGEIKQFSFRVFNKEAKKKKFYFFSQNFVSDGGETGGQKFLEEEGDMSSDLADWIHPLIDFVEVESGKDKSVEAMIRIPRNAEPGGHYAVLWVSENDPKSNKSVSIKNNVGILILINVTGDVKKEANIKEFKVLDKFYNRLPVEFLTRIENKGTVHFKPKGDIIIKGFFGNEVDKINSNPRGSNVLPNSIRRIEGSKWEKVSELEQGSFWTELKNEWKNFAFGPYKAVLKVDYGNGEDNLLITESKRFWVFPWRVIIFVILSLVIFFILLKGYNKVVIKMANKKIKN